MGVLFALLAAVFAALVVVLTKAGLQDDLDPTLAFAVQAVLILLITWGIVLWQGYAHQLGGLSKRTWIFMTAAGICTALSTVCSYRALKLADVALVSPIERMSLVISVLLAAVFLKEKLTWQVAIGVVLMAGGAVLIGATKK